MRADLPDGGDRRCLAGSGAALQAEWIDSERIALVERKAIGANFRISEVGVARVSRNARCSNATVSASPYHPTGVGSCTSRSTA